MKQNARFWIYVNDGFVKLTLQPGQELRWHHAWHNGEGWSAEGYTWLYADDEPTVYETHDTDGRDCDGRLSTHDEFYCPIAELQTTAERPDQWEGFWADRKPNWERLKAWQRDYAAEAMGY